jgi:hypothetical protein
MMLLFKLAKASTHSRSAFEFDSQRNEEQNESKKMEVDSVVAPEPWPNKLEVTSDTRILSVLQMVIVKLKVLPLFKPLCLPKL